MKKKLTILSAFAVAVFSYATMSSNISSAKYLEPDYKQERSLKMQMEYVCMCVLILMQNPTVYNKYNF